MVHIIITDFNGYAQTKICLSHLKASTYQHFTTVIVDHGTTDETSEKTLIDFPDAIVIKGNPDLWWTGAVNMGIQYALANGSDRIMLLNNDCYMESKSLENLIKHTNDHSESIIAPVQYNWSTGEINTIAPYSSFLLGFPTRPGPRKLTQKMKKDEIISSDLIVGGRGVIIPSQIFELLGFFDENNLPHYGADHDFYLRAKKKGVKLLIATDSFVGVDDTKTTIAKLPYLLSFKEFWNTLYDIRSHRNIFHVKALFKKHYPISHLYIIGVVLYLGRYTGIYLIQRLFHVLKK